MIGKFKTENIVMEISKLQAEEFIGVCKILDVDLIDDNDVPRSFIDMWAEIIVKIEKLNRTRRKNLLRLLRAANEDR